MLAKTSERLRYFPKKYNYEADVTLLEVVHVSTTELAYMRLSNVLASLA